MIKSGESKTLEFQSTLPWNLKEDRQDDGGVTYAVLKAVAAFLNGEGGDLLIGVSDDQSVIGIEVDRLETPLVSAEIVAHERWAAAERFAVLFRSGSSRGTPAWV